MLPIWAPYVPCRNEAFLLSNRRVLADQHEYLAARLPKHSGCGCINNCNEPPALDAPARR